MRIAQVVSGLSLGGQERVAVTLANRLSGSGHCSHLVCTRTLGPLADSVAPDVHVCLAERTSRWDRRGMRRIADHLNHHEIQVVHTHGISSSYLMRFVLRHCRRRPVHVVHDHYGATFKNRAKVWLHWALLRNVDGFIAVIQDSRDRAAGLLRLPDERCVYIPNGIEIPVLDRRPSGSATIVQTANFLVAKDHETAMRAAARVREQVNDLQWFCLGRIDQPHSEYFQAVERLMDELNLHETVRLTGVVRNVSDYLAQAHLGVLSSRTEAFPISVLEYMAAGLPVVVTAVGQLPRLVGDAGLVVPPGNPDALADGIVSLLRDPCRAAEMGQRGRQSVIDQYSVDAMTREIERLYDRLLRDRKHTYLA
jgi:glycosyltransferase involved in cell wall biosynthesis